jgi:hypothetical protein
MTNDLTPRHPCRHIPPPGPTPRNLAASSQSIGERVARLNRAIRQNRKTFHER